MSTAYVNYHRMSMFIAIIIIIIFHIIFNNLFIIIFVLSGSLIRTNSKLIYADLMKGGGILF